MLLFDQTSPAVFVFVCLDLDLSRFRPPCNAGPCHHHLAVTLLRFCCPGNAHPAIHGNHSPDYSILHCKREHNDTFLAFLTHKMRSWDESDFPCSKLVLHLQQKNLNSSFSTFREYHCCTKSWPSSNL